MSIDLAVKLTCSVGLNALLSGTEKALQEILQLSRRPSVQAEAYPSAAPTLMPWSVLESRSGMIRISIEGYEEDPVFLFVSDRTGDPITSEGRGTFAIVEVHGDSAGLALAPAVALAIANECGSEIEDNRPYFTSSFEQSPDSFLKKMRLENVSDDLGLAAKDFRRSIAEKRTRG